MVEFYRDSAGIAEILKSDDVRDLLRLAAHLVAADVRAQGHIVEDGSPLPVEVQDERNTDRAGVSVVIPHPSGVGMEAKYGLLKRAAAENGMSAKGFRKPRRSRKRKRKRKRRRT
ncbi:hypothetical protein [Lentzea sp. NBRC 102530]|uniref:hypothetical protein n=1 Tax=Lentzea sp. NBRC 102530 TaxID=3032201 RepID=UPI0024A5E542|nr:hypothetical protein [Lentzea sp. NBRC 102530]GLY51299.1 hypothetical protein Lesp01_49550 [Lentzea sp. NBRC 102530]